MRTPVYHYRGMISGYSIERMNNGEMHLETVLYRISDDTIPPVFVNVYGEIAEYINALECTDREERYIDWDFYYDRSFNLLAISIPSRGSNIPAKVIAAPKGECFDYGMVIFGQREYIDTNDPKPMDREQYSAFCDFRCNVFYAKCECMGNAYNGETPKRL